MGKRAQKKDPIGFLLNAAICPCHRREAKRGNQKRGTTEMKGGSRDWKNQNIKRAQKP